VGLGVSAPAPVLGVLGDIAEDVVVWQQAPLAVGSDTPSRIVRTRGGSAANVAAFAAPLVATRFLGCVGDDAAGSAVVRALTSEGVDVRVTTGSRTGVIVVLVDAVGERTMLPDRGANGELADVPGAWLDDLACLHVTAYSLLTEPTATTCARALRRVRGLTSVDASSASVLRTLGPEAFSAWVERLDPDVVFANAEEAHLLGWDVHAAAPRLTIVKHGREPVLVRTRAGAAAHPVPVVADARDSTGAGDAFAAGFLAGLLRSPAADLRSRRPDDPALAAWCRLGHDRAAGVLTRPGAGRPL